MRRMKLIGQTGTLAVLSATFGLGSGCAGPGRVCISGIQEGRPFHLAASRAARIEALAVQLLESSGYENDEEVANPDRWRHFETRDNVSLTFNPPRNVRVQGSPLAITKLMIPIAKDHSPAHLFVRSSGRIRAFCKYSCEAATALRTELGNSRDNGGKQEHPQ